MIKAIVGMVLFVLAALVIAILPMHTLAVVVFGAATVAPIWQSQQRLLSSKDLLILGIAVVVSVLPTYWLQSDLQLYFAAACLPVVFIVTVEGMKAVDSIAKLVVPIAGVVVWLAWLLAGYGWLTGGGIAIALFGLAMIYFRRTNPTPKKSQVL